MLTPRLTLRFFYSSTVLLTFSNKPVKFQLPFGDLNARTGDANAREAAFPVRGLNDESADSDLRRQASGCKC